MQVNYALGFLWDDVAMKELFNQFQRILKFIDKNKNRGIELINFSTLRREPAVLNTEITVDYDGGIFYETGICLEEDFFEMKNNFYAGNIGKVRNISLLCPTQTKAFFLLSKVYAEHNKHFREIILSNIELGIRFKQKFRRYFCSQ